MDKVRIKLVKSGDSINVISNEESYYANGVSSRKLEGEEYEYITLSENDLMVLAKHVDKIISRKYRAKRRKYKKDLENSEI